jgi:hypothetical protein
LSPRLALAAALVLAASLGSGGACRAAGLILAAPDLTATPGSRGSFDVLLTNTNPAGGASYDVAVDSFQLGLSGPLALSFTEVSIATVAAPYIYVTSGTTQGGGPLSSDRFPNTQFTASDSEFASPGFRTVTPGDLFGLAHVSYAVSPTTATGLDRIGFLKVSLTDLAGTAIPVTISNGSIRVGSVPEPSVLIQAATAAVIGLGASWWCRRERGSVGCRAGSQGNRW